MAARYHRRRTTLARFYLSNASIYTVRTHCLISGGDIQGGVCRQDGGRYFQNSRNGLLHRFPLSENLRILMHIMVAKKFGFIRSAMSKQHNALAFDCSEATNDVCDSISLRTPARKSIQDRSSRGVLKTHRRRNEKDVARICRASI